MSKPPSVSIIMPTYNNTLHIRDAIDSIRTQTFTDFELVVVNDGATDDTPAICHQYAEADPRVTVIDLPINQGSGKARNIGIAHAKGTYLIFCDADDAYPPRALEILLTRAKSENSPVAGGNLAMMDASLTKMLPLMAYLACIQFFETKTVTLAGYPALWFPFFHPRYLISKEFLISENLLYPDLRRGQDPPFLANVLCRAKSVAICPDIVYLYRNSQGGSRLRSLESVRAYLEHVDMTCAIFNEHGASKQKLLYLGLIAEELLSVSMLLSLSRQSRKECLHFFASRLLPNLQAMRGEDFSPYVVTSDKLEKSLTDLDKGLFVFLVAQTTEKIRRVLGK